MRFERSELRGTTSHTNFDVEVPGLCNHWKRDIRQTVARPHGDIRAVGEYDEALASVAKGGGRVMFVDDDFLFDGIVADVDATHFEEHLTFGRWNKVSANFEQLTAGRSQWISASECLYGFKVAIPNGLKRIVKP